MLYILIRHVKVSYFYREDNWEARDVSREKSLFSLFLSPTCKIDKDDTKAKSSSARSSFLAAP